MESPTNNASGRMKKSIKLKDDIKEKKSGWNE